MYNTYSETITSLYAFNFFVLPESTLYCNYSMYFSF